MEPFVMCLANKKVMSKMHKELMDLVCIHPVIIKIWLPASNKISYDSLIVF